MRLRLDKLVLSAGLALAIVATSIPAIAGTETATPTESDGLSLNGSTVHLVQNAFENSATADTSTLAFATAVTGLSLGGDAEAKTGLTGKVTSVEVTEGNAGDVGDASNTLKSKVKDDGYDVSTTQAAQKTKTYKVTVISTYSYKKNVDLSTEVTTAINEVEEGATEEAKVSAGKTAITEKAATKLTTANYEDINNKVKVDTTSTDFDYGTKQTTEVGDAVDATHGVKVTSDLTSIKTVEALKAAASSIEVTLSRTATTTYTLTKLPSGYTYDILFNVEAPSKEYKVYMEDKTNTEQIVASPVESSIVNDGKNVKVSVSDVNSAMTYFLGEKTVSATGALLFASTEGDDTSADVVSGDYTANIRNATQGDEGIDLTKVADLPEDVKSAGNFVINVKKDDVDVENGPEMTFKIAIPKDVQPTSADKKINWIVVRSHNYQDGNGNTVEIIPSTVEGDYIVFSSDKFSTYALLYNEVAADTTEEETNNETNNETESATEAGTGTETTTTTAGSSTTSTTASEKTGDNSMMPLFMTTLLLALCAGSLAIYKEKKTN